MCTAPSKGFWGSFLKVYVLLIHLIEAAFACAFKDVLSFLPKMVFFQAVALGILSTKMVKHETCLDAFASHAPEGHILPMVPSRCKHSCVNAWLLRTGVIWTCVIVFC